MAREGSRYEYASQDLPWAIDVELKMPDTKGCITAPGGLKEGLIEVRQ